MLQQLSVNLTIPIPVDSVLILKTELEELKQSQYDGVYCIMKISKKSCKKATGSKDSLFARF